MPLTDDQTCQIEAALADVPFTAGRRIPPVLVCSLVYPSGQAYRVWDDTGGFGDTMEEHARMAADIGRGVSDGKVLYLPNHLRLEPVAPG